MSAVMLQTSLLSAKTSVKMMLTKADTLLGKNDLREVSFGWRF